MTERGANSRSRHHAPTLDDVAGMAGVSRMTASRVVNNERYVSARARDAVNEAIAKTGYVVHHAARSLVTRRTDSVAFVIAERHRQFFEDPHLVTVIIAAGAVLGQRGQQLVLLVASNDQEQQRISRYIRAGHVDGAVLLSLGRSSQGLLDDLLKAQANVVVVGEVAKAAQVSRVFIDNRTAAREMTRYLRSVGCQRIATITGPLDRSTGKHRLTGYKDGVGRGNVREDLIVEGDFSRRSGELGMTRLLAQAPDIDGVFAASDAMAAGALAVLNHAGRRVPDDVRLAGFDDSPVAVETKPVLTTMRQPVDEIGRQAVELLLRQLDGDHEAVDVRVTTEFVKRDSA
jgi:DNA-binding LacI/PurR family transcriptional regulator